MTLKSIGGLVIIALLSGCSNTLDKVDEMIGMITPDLRGSPPTIVIDGNTYKWKKWSCQEYGNPYSSLLRIGYIPGISEGKPFKGMLFLNDSEIGIDTTYSLQGVHHYWSWDDYQMVIESDGSGRFYDFHGASSGEKRKPAEVYDCTFVYLE